MAVLVASSKVPVDCDPLITRPRIESSGCRVRSAMADSLKGSAAAASSALPEPAATCAARVQGGHAILVRVVRDRAPRLVVPRGPLVARRRAVAVPLVHTARIALRAPPVLRVVFAVGRRRRWWWRRGWSRSAAAAARAARLQCRDAVLARVLGDVSPGAGVPALAFAAIQSTVAVQVICVKVVSSARLRSIDSTQGRCRRHGLLWLTDAARVAFRASPVERPIATRRRRRWYRRRSNRND